MSDDGAERLARLYPHVHDTPLPRAWSSKDRFQYIKLSRSNLRVHYNGLGKNHKDAASVRATHPIPAACGIYYFEVRIVSKGRDGYMGIGLADGKVNMNRLPGWEPHSYGYHGDDGHSFCSSGNGQPYGPTFTTGDVIGCCVNLINMSVFYTKNGVKLGTAFENIPLNLYPTVGLQSPGEIADANFGDKPFVFDIEGYMLEWKTKLQEQIASHPTRCLQSNDMDATLKKLVFDYLVHHGYCRSAESFAKSTNMYFFEDISSIQSRQRLQKLVLQGKIGDAITTTNELFPNLLDNNPNLEFKIRIRHFIEMINDLDQNKRPSHPYSIASLMNGSEGAAEESDKMEVDSVPSEVPTGTMATESEQEDPHSNRQALEHLLLFGRELAGYSANLTSSYDSLKTQLQEAFSLLAYKDPKQSPMSYLLHPSQREQLCADLNSAILESHGLARQPPLENAISQTKNVIERMLKVGFGSGAYCGLEKYLNCSLKPQ